MKTELLPNHVGEVVPFSVATCDHLEKPELREIRGTTFGKIFNEGHLAWLVNGPSLEVVWTSNGERQATWEFGVDLPDASVSVSCVTEMKEDRKWKLIVGMDYDLNSGCLCIFDLSTSKVVKAITLPQKVTSVEVVSQTGSLSADNGQFCTELRYMHGIVAVGTQRGHVYLLDLVFDDLICSDELDPSHLTFITKQTHNIPSKRMDSIARNRHLALHLNDGCQAWDRFLFRNPDDDVAMSTLSDEVYVSSLLFVRQNGCLSVGFNFGGFQLWNLNKLQLVFTSDCSVAAQPVVTFVFREPDNDPRNFCYLWVVRGQPSIEAKQDEMTNAALFSMSFDHKIYLDGFGYFYRDLISCFLRFEFVLGHNVISPERSHTVSSRLINCVAIEEQLSQNFGHSLGDAGSVLLSKDEGTGRGLTLFVWESAFADPNIRPKVVLAIFDLNQWYQAQMPTKFRHGNLDTCSYFGFFSMDNISEKALPDFLLDVYVPNKSICRIKTSSTAEKFYYPASIAFDAVSLIDTGVIHASFLGLHKQIFLDLTKNGPTALVNPQDTYNVCVYNHLLPLHGELLNPSLSLNGQREGILSLALEYNLLGFLIACVREWSTGKYNNEGCSLRFLQEWAWKRVYHIKTTIDKHCLPLFDCSGLQLDTLTVQMLHHHACQLKHLELLFRDLSEQTRSIPTTDQGARELEHKAGVISLLSVYLEAVLWFLNCGLLPESSDGDGVLPCLFSYPSSLLTQIYSNRRFEIQRLSGTIGPTDVLLIDGLIINAGESLSASWEKDGGNGLFPPNSFHALLNIYLLHNVDTVIKHQIVQYLFLDLAELLNHEQYSNLVDQLVKFPAAFSVSPSIIKLTQGFWLLDHKDYEEAITVLLHPIISPTDILPWQHHHIMKAFLYQGEAQKALRYARVRKPTMHTIEEVRFHLTLLLANGLVSEAFQYQRTSRSQLNSEDLLQHFFLGCQQTKNFRVLLHLPLSPLEERQLIEYLNTSSDPHARELLVIYYLQRSRYVDAMRINGQLIPRVMHEADPAARERSATRNAIVDGFSKLLPHIHYQLTQGAKSLFGSGKNIWQQVPRPQPLTTHVKANSNEPISRSSLIETVMGKIAEVWSTPVSDYIPTDSSCIVPEVLPFVGIPSESTSEKKHEQVSHVIFPTIISKDADASHCDPSLYHISPAKKSRYLDVSPVHLSQSLKRSSAKHYNIEVLSLLQTPPVRRKIPSVKLMSAASPLNPTPQSILKVRALNHLNVSSKLDNSNDVLSPSLKLVPSPPVTPLAVELSNDSTESSMVDDKIDSRKLRFRFSPSLANASSASSERSVSPPLRDLPTETSELHGSIESISSIEVQPSPRRPLHAKTSTFASEDLPLSESFTPNKNAVDLSDESNNSSKSTEVYEHEVMDYDDEFHTDESNFKFRKEHFKEERSEKCTSSVTSTHINTDSASIKDSKDALQITKSFSSSHLSVSTMKAAKHVESPQLGVPSLVVENVAGEDNSQLLKAITVSTAEQIMTMKEKTPSPRPRTSFFSAEKSKERYQQMKSELVKAGGSSNLDVDNAEIELVEAESPLASLVKQTLDSVFSKCDAEMSSKLATLGSFSTEKQDSFGSPLKVDVSDATLVTPERPLTKCDMSPPVLHISPRTRSQARLEMEAGEASVASEFMIQTRSSGRKSTPLSPSTMTRGFKKHTSANEDVSTTIVIEDSIKSHFKDCMQKTSQLLLAECGEMTALTDKDCSSSKEQDSCLLKVVPTTNPIDVAVQKLSTLHGMAEVELSDSSAASQSNPADQDLKTTFRSGEIGGLLASSNSSNHINNKNLDEESKTVAAQAPLASLMKKTLDSIFSKSDVDMLSSLSGDRDHHEDVVDPVLVDTGNNVIPSESSTVTPHSQSIYNKADSTVESARSSVQQPHKKSTSLSSPKVHSSVHLERTHNTENTMVTEEFKKAGQASPKLAAVEQGSSNDSKSDSNESPKVVELNTTPPSQIKDQVSMALQAFDSEPRTGGLSKLHIATRDIDTSTTTLEMDVTCASSTARHTKSIIGSQVLSSVKEIEQEEKTGVVLATVSSPALRTRSHSRQTELMITTIPTSRPRTRRHSEHAVSGEETPRPRTRRQSGQVRTSEKLSAEVEPLRMALRTRNQSSHLETVKELLSEQTETLSAITTPQSARLNDPVSDTNQATVHSIIETPVSAHIQNYSVQRSLSPMANIEEVLKEDDEAHPQSSFTMITRSNKGQREASVSPSTRSSTSLTVPRSSPQSKTPSPLRSSSGLSSKSSTPSHSPKNLKKEGASPESPIREARSSSRLSNKSVLSSKSSSPSGSLNITPRETSHQSHEMALTLRSGTHIPRLEFTPDEKEAVTDDEHVVDESVLKMTDKRSSKSKIGGIMESARRTTALSSEAVPSDIFKAVTRKSKSSKIGQPARTFSFSQPATVELEEADHELLETSVSTTATTFIFSPPLTRSKSRKTRKLSKDDSPGSSSALRSSSIKDTSFTAVSGSRSTPRSGKKMILHKTSRRVTLSPNETPINFVSPELNITGESSSKPRIRKLSSHYSLRRTVALRKQKGFSSPRLSAKLK